MTTALDVAVYPNPSTAEFNVEAHFEGAGNYSLIVRDILGRVVESYRDINYLPVFAFGKTLHSGIYFMEVTRGDERQIVRVVKSE